MKVRPWLDRQFVPPRSWSAWREQMVGAAVTAAVILGLLAAVASDVPWTLELGVLAALTLVSAGATAWRIRRYRRR